MLRYHVIISDDSAGRYLSCELCNVLTFCASFAAPSPKVQ